MERREEVNCISRRGGGGGEGIRGGNGLKVMYILHKGHLQATNQH